VAIRRQRSHFPPASVGQALRANWDHPDRYVRMAAAGLAAELSDQECRDLAQHAHSMWSHLTLDLGAHATDPTRALSYANVVLMGNGLDRAYRLAAVRLIQRTRGGLTSAKSRGTV